MSFYKIKKILGIGCALILLGGCTPEIPEGDIKDFVDAIDFDNTYEKVNYGKSVINVKHYLSEENLAGELTITTYMDKTDDKYYQYCETLVSGNFYGTNEDQYNFHREQALVFVNEEGHIETQKIVDNQKENLVHSNETMMELIKGFFYLELEGGYHRGGMYYGDYVKANCGRYYQQFSLNETKDKLNYKINTSSFDVNEDEVITLHSFTVDKLGMLCELSTTTFYVEKPEKVITTISCDYNEFEKIYKL